MKEKKTILPPDLTSTAPIVRVGLLELRLEDVNAGISDLKKDVGVNTKGISFLKGFLTINLLVLLSVAVPIWTNGRADKVPQSTPPVAMPTPEQLQQMIDSGVLTPPTTVPQSTPPVAMPTPEQLQQMIDSGVLTPPTTVVMPTPEQFQLWIDQGLITMPENGGRGETGHEDPPPLNPEGTADSSETDDGG